MLILKAVECKPLKLGAWSLIEGLTQWDPEAGFPLTHFSA
jgi:hypothetical protein